MPIVTLEDFIASFGAEKEGMPEDCKDLIREKDFEYEILTGADRDAVLLEVIKKLKS